MKKILSLSLLFIFALLVESAIAVEITNYDGKFVRGAGAPVTKTVTFPGVEGTAVLKLFNGAEDDTLEKVSSSIIKVNGVDIFAQDSFNQNVSYLEKEIQLIEGDNNTIAVEVRGKPEGTLKINIVQKIEVDAAAFIGPEGGVIQTESGVTLEIPAGSLNSVEQITATLVSEEQYGRAAELENNQKMIGIVNFGPDGLIFNNPVTVTYPIDVYVNPETVLPIFVYDKSTAAFVQTDWNCTVGLSGNDCTGYITHFSDSGPALPSSIDTLWLPRWRAWFADEGYGYRLPNKTRTISNSLDVYYRDESHTAEKYVCAQLYCSIPIELIDEYQDREPVVFIHGYQKRNDYGGGAKYWGDFPALLQELDNDGRKYIAFDFQWRTNARFEDVAEDLYEAIKRIYDNTHKRVHIVAHSMGGILARTMLQKIYAEDESVLEYSADDYVASLVTIGTPHSGIADEQKVLVDTPYPREDLVFPIGQDSSFPIVFSDKVYTFQDFGDKISMHQLGAPPLGNEDDNPLNREDDYLVQKVSAGVLGDLANKLAHSDPSSLDFWPLPANLPVLSAIGLYNYQSEGIPGQVINRIGCGDRLITYEGQRFHPDLTTEGYLPLLIGQDAFKNSEGVYRKLGANITEILLGLGDQDLIPGDIFDLDKYSGVGTFGAIHSAGMAGINPFWTYSFKENYVMCSSANNCNHPSFLAVKDWLAKHSSSTPFTPYFRISIPLIDSINPDLGLFASENSFLVLGSNGQILDTIYDGYFLSIPFTANEEYKIQISIEGYETKIITYNAGPWIDQPSYDFPQIALDPSTEFGTCGAYVAPGVWKEFDCYNLAAIGKTTNDDPFTPSWRLIGGYWQSGGKGPDPSDWYDTNTANFAHGPTGSPEFDEADPNSGEISEWDSSYAAADGAWSDDEKTVNDPCPAGYRIPTNSQWQGVINIDNNTQSVVGTTWSSSATNYSSARFFGDDLMLPAAGYRNNYDGSLHSRGYYGIYWSSTQYSSYSYYAWGLIFGGSCANTYYDYRSYGFSVRCVAE